MNPSGEGEGDGKQNSPLENTGGGSFLEVRKAKYHAEYSYMNTKLRAIRLCPRQLEQEHLQFPKSIFGGSLCTVSLYDDINLASGNSCLPLKYSLSS